MVKELEWGISPPTERAIAFGARAIYNGSSGFDLLRDRMVMEGGTDTQRKQFGEFLDKKGIPALREQLKSNPLSSSSKEFINIHLDGWFITASPRESCGYLYIGVFPCDNGDPTYVPEYVPAPVAKPSLAKCKAKARK